MAQSIPFRESPTLKKYRELLGVTETATEEELKKAYYKRAFLYHPDRNSDPQAPEQFQKVREAYECLTDPAAVESLKQSHLKERLFDICVEGIQISFGSFFGYRSFVSGHQPLTRDRRIGLDPGPDLNALWESSVYIESDRSILDDPAFDSIEVVYAGRFSSEDEDRLMSDVKMTAHQQLPWVLLNNKGILEFLKADYTKALKCYEELNRRIRNNIIFMYREALCHIIIGFQNPRRSFFGTLVPDKREIKKGIQLLKKCIHIGATRPVGKQKCVVIRKVLADTLDKSGRRRSARKVWNEIRTITPRSVEANLRSGHTTEASALLRKKAKSRISAQSVNRALLRQRS